MFEPVISLGQVITAVTPILAVVWAVARFSQRTNEFFRIVKRHEAILERIEMQMRQHEITLARLLERDHTIIDRRT